MWFLRLVLVFSASLVAISALKERVWVDVSGFFPPLVRMVSQCGFVVVWIAVFG
jgi:hypothetical protein